MTARMNNIVAVVLAAGGSRRFGEPKQLAVIDGESLLRRALAAACGSRCNRVVVVLGSDFELILKSLDGCEVGIIRNRDWREGIASSIRAALRELRGSTPVADAVLIMTCDQPLVSPEVLDRLIEKCDRTGSTMAACEYGGRLGVPALFTNRHFGELLSLRGDGGARGILRGHPGMVAAVPWPEGALDIDTPEDLAGLATP